MSDPSAAAAYAVLRAETCGMFGYDLANLSLTQGLQTDLLALLRLEIDTLQGRALAGEAVDLDRLAAAHGLLQKMLPERSLIAPAKAPETARFGLDHRARLRALIEATVFAPEADEAARLADAMRREEATAAGEAAGLPPEAPVEPLAAVPVPAPVAAPATPPVPRSQPNSRPPAHYMKGPDPPWNPYVGAVIAGPWGLR